jgi:hypothetical protein
MPAISPKENPLHVLFFWTIPETARGIIGNPICDLHQEGQKWHGNLQS